MDKVIRDGKVAVAVSLGYGAGWTTWNSEISPFEPKVIEMIEANRTEEITQEWCLANLGIDGVCCLGASQLDIEWIPQGVRFSFSENDGYEEIHRSDQLSYEA